MQYLSPAKFTGETTFAPLDKKAIQLARKKLFADLELSGETTIELNGIPFSKNDIIQYFEDLSKEDVLNYHNAIGGDKVLLHFLENAQIGRKEKFQGNPLYENEQFINWVSPYYCSAFTAFMENCFAELNEDALVALLVNPFLMTAPDVDKALEAVTRIINGDINSLELYNEQFRNNGVPTRISVEQIRGLMEFSHIRLLQLLPQNRFASLRDKYALCMLVACIGTFNKNGYPRETVRTWLENAELLAVGADVKAEISKKLAEMAAIQNPVASRKGGSASGASIFKGVLVVLIFIIRLATCNSHSTSYNHDNSYLRSVTTVDTSILRILRTYADSSNVRPEGIGAAERVEDLQSGEVTEPVLKPKSNNHLDTSKASITYKIKRQTHK